MVNKYINKIYLLKHFKDFPGGSDGKESACNAGDLGSIPGLGSSPGGGHGNLLHYSCLENPHGQRILVGYSPQGRKQLDLTEQLSTAQVQFLRVQFNQIRSDQSLSRVRLFATS